MSVSFKRVIFVLNLIGENDKGGDIYIVMKTGYTKLFLSAPSFEKYKIVSSAWSL